MTTRSLSRSERDQTRSIPRVSWAADPLHRCSLRKQRATRSAPAMDDARPDFLLVQAPGPAEPTHRRCRPRPSHTRQPPFQRQAGNWSDDAVLVNLPVEKLLFRTRNNPEAGFWNFATADAQLLEIIREADFAASSNAGTIKFSPQLQHRAVQIIDGSCSCRLTVGFGKGLPCQHLNVKCGRHCLVTSSRPSMRYRPPL